MIQRPKNAQYFKSIVVMEPDFIVVSGHLYSEGTIPSFTRLSMLRGGKWSGLTDFEDIIHASTKKPVTSSRSKSHFCLLGRSGTYREMALGIKFPDTTIDIHSSGYLKDLRYIGDHLFACGTQNQIHRQKENNQWERFDHGIFSPLEERVDRILESIDGFSEADIYAVGMLGHIWHWDGKSWTLIDCLTNLTFYSVLCASDGYVYVGGGGGLLYRGNKEKGWVELTDQSVSTEMLKKMVEFQGHIYIAAMTKLLRISKGILEEVEIPLNVHKAFLSLDAISDQMWTVGDDSILKYNGTTWTRYVYPNNE
jgi:hypothetical protein